MIPGCEKAYLLAYLLAGKEAMEMRAGISQTPVNRFPIVRFNYVAFAEDKDPVPMMEAEVAVLGVAVTEAAAFATVRN
jgi:hypothetical protein